MKNRGCDNRMKIRRKCSQLFPTSSADEDARPRGNFRAVMSMRFFCLC